MDCYPGAPPCAYPNDPPPFWRGTRVIHPLSADRLLVISHVQHVDSPDRAKARQERRNARSYDQVLISYTNIESNRTLTDREVQMINYVIKQRSIRYVASVNIEDLYPEKAVGQPKWANIDSIFHQDYPTFYSQSETFIKYRDDSLLFTNAYGERNFVPGWFVRQQEKKKKD
jgi:hypothetical protein